MYKGIDYNAMVERAKKLNKVTIKHTDLMTDVEKEIWQNLEIIYQDSIRLEFALLLVKNNLDRKIVLSPYLNDDRIFIK